MEAFESIRAYHSKNPYNSVGDALIRYILDHLLCDSRHQPEGRRYRKCWEASGETLAVPPRREPPRSARSDAGEARSYSL